MTYFSFPIDSPFERVKFVTVLASEADAREAASAAVRAEFGPVAKLIGGASPSYGPDPVCDVPCSKSKSAWLGMASA